MNKAQPLEPGLYYHIFNRGNNRENLFNEDRNYEYFFKLYTHYIHPFTKTYAYCLMPNHFHLLIQIKTEEELKSETSQVSETCEVLIREKNNLSRQFSHLFNAYAKSINKLYGRTGSLFEERFHRLPVTSDSYFLSLVFYIHYNPQKHGLVEDYRDWKWSSYKTLISQRCTHLARDEVMDWFGNTSQFKEFHKGLVDEKQIAHLIEQD
jgi:putative transposase